MVKKILNFDYPTVSGWSISQNFSKLKLGNTSMLSVYYRTQLYTIPIEPKLELIH